MFRLQTRKVCLGDAPTPVEAVVCPICFGVFTCDQLEQLTIEDAPQKQLMRTLGVDGTGRRCLTCFRCNSLAGNGYENRHALNPPLTDKPPPVNRALNAPTLSPLSLAVFLSMVEQALSDKDRVVRTRIEQKWDPVQSFGLDQRKIELKSAYIIAFATLGYTYVQQPVVETVRRVIADPSPGIAFGSCATSKFFEPAKVYVFHKPITAVAVSLPSLHQHSEDGQHVVFLPHGDRTLDDVFRFVDAGNLLDGSPVEWSTFDWPQSGFPTFAWDAAHGVERLILRLTTDRHG